MSKTPYVLACVAMAIIQIPFMVLGIAGEVAPWALAGNSIAFGICATFAFTIIVD